ncbi:MAG: DUF86 domain-containing protein [Candidatus Hodarchaeota archaeon]
MNREEQYKRKLEYIADKILDLPENVEEDQFYVDALYYRLQTSIDATMDVVAMLCKDLGFSVKDDYSNLDQLSDSKVTDSNLVSTLRRLNGLRNILVHQYNKIELTIVLEEKKIVVETLQRFVILVEKVINDLLDLNNED